MLHESIRFSKRIDSVDTSKKLVVLKCAECLLFASNLMLYPLSYNALIIRCLIRSSGRDCIRLGVEEKPLHDAHERDFSDCLRHQVGLGRRWPLAAFREGLTPSNDMM